MNPYEATVAEEQQPMPRAKQKTRWGALAVLLMLIVTNIGTAAATYFATYTAVYQELADKFDKQAYQTSLEAQREFEAKYSKD